jgi:hypothetical protein
MIKEHEDLIDQTLHWMHDNLQGAYNAKYPPKHPRAGKYCVNSGTCILVCCYINALGKVLLKGGGKDSQRFSKYLECCMPDFQYESMKKKLQLTLNGESMQGDRLLYKVFRCGFVHGFYPSSTNVAWGRRPDLHEYWIPNRLHVTLNVDEFVRGFERGIKIFRQLLDADPDLRAKFREYLLA